MLLPPAEIVGEPALVEGRGDAQESGVDGGGGRSRCRAHVLPASMPLLVACLAMEEESGSGGERAERAGGGKRAWGRSLKVSTHEKENGIETNGARNSNLRQNHMGQVRITCKRVGRRDKEKGPRSRR